MMTCAEMAAKLRLAGERAKTELAAPTQELMTYVETEAKTVIGTYDFGWQQLAASTQADRAAQGYPPNEPLLRSGEMRDSIISASAPTGVGAEGLVYSSDIKAVWQEMGTSKGIPPRSFLMQSLVRSIPMMGKLYAAFAERIIAE